MSMTTIRRARNAQVQPYPGRIPTASATHQTYIQRERTAAEMERAAREREREKERRRDGDGGEIVAAEKLR